MQMDDEPKLPKPLSPGTLELINLFCAAIEWGIAILLFILLSPLMLFGWKPKRRRSWWHGDF